MQFTPVMALYDPLGVDVPLNLDNTHIDGDQIDCPYCKCGHTMLLKRLQNNTHIQVRETPPDQSHSLVCLLYFLRDVVSKFQVTMIISSNSQTFLL